MRQKFNVLNELVHGIIRSKKNPEVRDFYLSTLKEIETGQGSWKDKDYWMTQMVLLRTVLRSAPPARQQLPPGRTRRNIDSTTTGLQPQDCCHQFNNDGCNKDSPHTNNDPTRSPETVHHYCKNCLRKNLRKVHAAKACKEGSAGQWLAHPSGSVSDHTPDASENISDTEEIFETTDNFNYNSSNDNSGASTRQWGLSRDGELVEIYSQNLTIRFLWIEILTTNK